MNTEERLEPVLGRLSHWSLIITIAISVLSLIGWISGLTILKSIRLYYIPIAPSTALCFFIPSIAFLIYLLIPNTLLRTITVFCASLTILIASILLISFFMGIMIEAEHLGFTQIPFQTTHHTGHMSPVTAIMFIVASSGILLLCLPTREKQLYKNAASFMGLSVSIAGLIITLGYLHGTPLFYSEPLTPVAFQTALAFLFFGLGIIFKSGASVPAVRLFAGPSIRSRLTRAFLPVAVASVLISDLLEDLVLYSRINPALVSYLVAMVSAITVGIIIAKIAISISREVDQANRERDEKVIALQKSKERYQSLLEQAGYGILIHDTNGNILSINKSFVSMHGFTVEEIARMGLAALDVEGTALVSDRIRRIMNGETLSFEVEHSHKNGHTFPLEVTANLISSGNEQLIISIHRDLTERKRAEKKLQDTLESLRKSVGTTIQVMASAVETRDPYTSGHQIRTADLARSIATEMGLPQEKIDAIRMASSIHDIGKLSIPSEILSKPTKLSEIEFSLIKEHAWQGYEILKGVESSWPLAEIVYQHHERMDGSGYPRNLKGEEILIEARIIAVADVMEAMASHRPYRPTLGIDAALNEIEKNRGILYDNAVVNACLRLFREKGYQIEET